MISQEKIINSLKNYENYGDLINDKIRYHKVILSNRKIKYSMVEFTKELYYYVANTVGIFVEFIPME